MFIEGDILLVSLPYVDPTELAVTETSLSVTSRKRQRLAVSRHTLSRPEPSSTWFRLTLYAFEGPVSHFKCTKSDYYLAEWTYPPINARALTRNWLLYGIITFILIIEFG